MKAAQRKAAVDRYLEEAQLSLARAKSLAEHTSAGEDEDDNLVASSHRIHGVRCHLRAARNTLHSAPKRARLL